MSEGKETRELELPPVATANNKSLEVLRVWAAPGEPQQLVLKTTWRDPGAWGLLLADVARHAANAYANEGRDRAGALARIREMLDAEFLTPTDEPKQL